MSSLTHINDECIGGVRVRCQDDDPTVWIESRHGTVSLHLGPANRAALRAALDEADRLAMPVIERRRGA